MNLDRTVDLMIQMKTTAYCVTVEFVMRCLGMGCMCSPGYRLTKDYGGDIHCEKCPGNEVVILNMINNFLVNKIGFLARQFS